MGESVTIEVPATATLTQDGELSICVALPLNELLVAANERGMPIKAFLQGLADQAQH